MDFVIYEKKVSSRETFDEICSSSLFSVSTSSNYLFRLWYSTRGQVQMIKFLFNLILIILKLLVSIVP